MRVLHVVGARPNFMKIAPIIREMSKLPSEFHQVLVHTGQHYDDNMSKVFFKDLGLPTPDYYLGVGSGTHAEQTARVMLAFEPLLRDLNPALVLVVGDVNSTLACALTSVKLDIRVAHVEAGLRSFDRTMPEEHNRVLTDHIADLLFTSSRDANDNLLREGIPQARIHFVGNVMIDTLVHLLPKTMSEAIRHDFGLNSRDYALATLHRPSNVDDMAPLSEILAGLIALSEELPVLFPMHPRTRARIAEFGLESQVAQQGGLIITDPMGYLAFLALLKHAALVITDSGGIQEETTYLGVPCLTVRPNTERPVTIKVGTNQLVVPNREALLEAAHRVLDGGINCICVPELWDGSAAVRIVEVLRTKLSA